MKFTLPEDLKALDADALASLLKDGFAAYDALTETEELSDEQIVELEDIATAIESINAETAARAADAQATSDRVAAAKAKAEAARPAAEEPAAPEDVAPETEEPVVDEVPAADDAASENVGEQELEPVTAAGKQSVVKRAAGVVPEPTAPEEIEKKTFSLIAAGDVPGKSVGQEFESDEEFIESFGKKLSALQPGRGNSSIRNSFALAELKKELDPQRTIFETDSAKVAGEKLKFVTDERNLPGGSLIATAGDWGAPSQIVYDIPIVEQAPDGLISLPTINVERGGFQHTLGIDFSVITGDSNFGFTQTEAQAAAQTVKPFIAPTNPTFVDERLKVLGYGMTAGLLTLKGYPELIKRYIQGSGTAFAKYKNKDTLTRLTAYLTTGITVTGIGSTGQDAIDAISFQANRLRTKYALKRTQTFEAIAPFWLLDVIRVDLAKRQGFDSIQVTDQYINALFSSRGVTVQWVNDWSAATNGVLGNSATDWPTTAPIGMWLSGTFVKAGGPVASYDLIYDYDHISVNTYVQLFREESTLVAKMLNVEALLFTIPTGALYREGRVGKDDLGFNNTGRTA